MSSSSSCRGTPCRMSPAWRLTAGTGPYVRQQNAEVGGSAVGRTAGWVDVVARVGVSGFWAQVKKKTKTVGRKDASTQTDEPRQEFVREDRWSQTDRMESSDVGVQTQWPEDISSEDNSAPADIVPASLPQTAMADAVAVKQSDAAVAQLIVHMESTTVESPRERITTLESTLKYWKKRHSLFSQFDQGIMMDEVSFFSVCPEILASHMARRCAFDTVVDPFCGAGGNVIQLAFTCRKVIALDVDPEKIKLARRNAQIYGVADKIDFRVGDCFRILSGVRADAVVTSPPWGGPGYSRRFDVDDLCSRDVGGMSGVLRMARAVAPRVVLHVPKTVDRQQCLDVSRNEGFGRVEIEDVSIDGRPNCANLYLKPRQDNRHHHGPAIFTKIDLASGCQKSRRSRSNELAAYAFHLDKTAEYLATAT